MGSYMAIHLSDLSEMIGTAKMLKTISNFSCKLNPEVENFLHNNAWDFSRKSLASTYFVFTKDDNEFILVGYFSLTHKYFQVDQRKLDSFSNTLKKRIDKFMPFDRELGCRIFSAPLIGQLGKNFKNGHDALISGADLLRIACNTVKSALRIIGGKIVCLECENTPKLVEFYKANGFNSFSRRYLDRDEKDKMSGEYLLQMLRYFA